jgi:alpha-glucoside transport system substrate-binding protein
VLVAVVGVLLIVLSLGGQNNPTATPTIQTPVAAAATAMQTASATVTTTLTPTLPTQTPQPTLTTLPRSSTATETRTAMVTWTATAAPSVTPNLATRAAATIAMRETATANAIASFTHTPTNTPTITLTPTETPNEEQTLAAIVAATETANAIASFTKTPTPTNTATFTPTATLTATPTPTYTVTLTPTLTSTPTATLAPALGPGCPFEMMSQELAAACTGAYAGKVVTVGGSQDADAAISLQNSFKEFEDWTGIKVVYTGDTNFASVITAKVEGGQAPDIADFSVPNLLKVFAKQGKIIDVGKFMNPDWLKKNYAKFWLDLAIVPGVSGNITGGVWGRGFVKSLVWYPKKAFDASGYKVPTTWDEMIALSDQIVNEGKTPWCIGIESGSATGWPATDWVEDILLRTAPPEVYDNWATPSDLSKRVKFTDPIVKAAVQKMDIIWKNDKYVYGGSKSIPVTSFSDSANAIFTVPPKCYLHRQANFVTLYFPNLRLGVDYDFFYFPPIDPKYGKPILGGADIWGLFNDRPEARAVIDWLSRGESVKTLVGDGFTLAPQNDFKPEWYANDAQRKISALMAQATVLRLDGSDQMPAEVGTDSFWTGMTSYYAGSTDLNTMLRQIDATWPTN